MKKVELEIYKALYQSRLYDQIDIEICCIFSLCRLKLHTGKWQEATELIEQLRKTVEQRNNSVYNTTMDICTAYLSCCIRHTENVPDWIKSNKQENGAFMYMNLGLHHVTSGYYALLKKEYVQLLVLCDEYERDWTKFRCQMGLLYCNIFRACSSYGLHDLDNAVKYLRIALDSAYRDGIILPFAEINSGVQELLKLPEIQNRYPEEYLTRLDDCCGRHVNSISLINDTPKLLSERELQILDLLCQDKTHQEIGNELFISVATV